VASVGVTVLGGLIAWALFRRGTALQEQPAGPVVTAARRNLYGDAFNETVFEKPGTYLTRALVYFDNKGIDGLVNGLAALVGGGSGACGGCRPVRALLCTVHARRRLDRRHRIPCRAARMRRRLG
jgi:hypothetical protein